MSIKRKTRKKKGGINPAEFNYLRSRYIHILEQRDRLERELQECRIVNCIELYNIKILQIQLTKAIAMYVLYWCFHISIYI